MKSVLIPSTGNPGTFVPLVSGDPTYNTEGASFDIRKLFYDLNQEGYNVIQVEMADVDSVVSWIGSVHSSLQTFLSAVETWFVEGGEYPDEPSLPELPDNYEVFYVEVVSLVNKFYSSLRLCSVKKMEKIFFDSLREGLDDLAAGENVINVGDHRIYSKSIAIDAIV